ncbi:MAG: FGGY family carbohydrate kinase [Limnohabitans sp.]
MSLTLVLDIGKTHAKLLLIDEKGQQACRLTHVNISEPFKGYTTLGVTTLTQWLLTQIPQLPCRSEISHISITTHGAAFCAMDDAGLVLPPMDYEWNGYGEFQALQQQRACVFEETGSPALPLGLNAGLQLAWLKHFEPQAWSRVRHLLPYPQYWAWWFCGQFASEVSSLGCHTHLWSPHERSHSSWAWSQGFDALSPPLLPAWSDLGPLRPELSDCLGLPAHTLVKVGAHDSNSCLARYLHTMPGATVISTGTWVVIMVTHGQPVSLNSKRDELLNVSVEGQCIPTGRFMGGREYAVLAGDANPALADSDHLLQLLQGGWRATPSFCEAGGPFSGQPGKVWQHDHAVALEDVPFNLRPALAAWYAAETSVHIIRHLSADPTSPVILEGPLSYNEAYVAAMAALLDTYAVWRSTDELEGTARGAWMLAQWPQRQSFQTGLSLVKPLSSVQHLLATCYEPNAAFTHPRVSSFARPRKST